MSNMRKYLVEFLGTFFLFLTIGFVIVRNGHFIISPMLIGSILMAMIYIGAPVSGGHYNPAVTLAVFIRGAMPKRDVLPYMAAQVVGAVIAALMIIMVFYHEISIKTPQWNNSQIHNLPLAEFLFTFMLAFVFLSVTTLKSTAGNPYFGLAIGGTAMAGASAVSGSFMSGALAVGNTICSGAFNPALQLGFACMSFTSWNSSVLIILANFAGGAAAALVFLLIHPKEAKRLKQAIKKIRGLIPLSLQK